MRGLKDMFDYLMNNHGYTKSDLKNMMNTYSAEGVDPMDMMKKNITLEDYAPVVDQLRQPIDAPYARQLKSAIDNQLDPGLILNTKGLYPQEETLYNLDTAANAPVYLEYTKDHFNSDLHDYLVDVFPETEYDNSYPAYNAAQILGDPNQNIIDRDMLMEKAGDMGSWFDEIQPALENDNDLATLYKYLMNKKPY